uniref:Polyprotein n=1 Tax=Chinese milk vetch nepovirus TaxID=3115761 RepID=A0AAT9JBG6_9SECO
MLGGFDPPHSPMGCGALCGVRTPYSKRSLAAAIREGILDGPHGRCHYCGVLAQIEKGVPQPKTATGVRCSCWRTAIAKCPKHGAQVTSAKVTKQGAPLPEKERVELPYKKQICDVVVHVGPLELIYPALVSGESEPQGATSLPKEEEYVPKGLTLAEAPLWLAAPLESRPYINAVPSVRLSQRDEFALIKKRLTKIGKEKMKRSRRERLDRAFHTKRQRAATQRKVEAVKDLVILARQQIALAELFADTKRRAQTPLSPAQVALVWELCEVERERSSSMEAFLLSAKAWKKRECPHMAPSQEVCLPPLKVVHQCTVPWSGSELTLTALRSSGVEDGTLGFRSLASRRGDLTCNSTLGFPSQSMAVTVAATSLKRARKVVASTINFVRTALSGVKKGVSEVAHKIKTKIPWFGKEDESAVGVTNGGVDVPPIVVAPVVTCDLQLHEIGVRNIYAFADDSWSADPTEFDEAFAIPWSRRCPPCEHSVEHWDLEGECEPLIYKQPGLIYDQAVTEMFTAMECLKEEEQAQCESTEQVLYSERSSGYDHLGSLEQWVMEKYCVSRPYYCISRTTRATSPPMFRNFPAYSVAFYVEFNVRREAARGMTGVGIKRTCVNPIRGNVLYLPARREYEPHQIMLNKKIARPELEFRVINYNPDGVGTRMNIGNHFIYCAECLEGCQWDDESLVDARIEKSTIDTPLGGGGIFYSAIPLVSRGDHRARGGVLKSLLSYTPFGDLTCNSALEVSEIQERMLDRDHVVPTIADLTTRLSQRKSKVDGAGENRVADKKALTEQMVFHQPGVLARMRGKGQKTKIAANLNSDRVTVRMHPRGEPVFTPLPRMSSEELRKLAERGFGSTSSVALDIGIQSHVPQGMPVVAFVNVMDTRIEDPMYSSLCGSYIDLGRDRAKTLCLPLANFPLTKSLEDEDDVLNGLVLATYFEDGVKFGVGRPVFQYGTLEFQEFKESAYSDFTRVRDHWDEIAKQQNTPGDRILAGFSVLGAVSQDYNQPLPEFGPINMRCPPKSKPVVATYQDPGKLARSASTRSFRMPSLGLPNATGRASIPIQSNIRQASRLFPGEEYTPARMSTCDSGLHADTSIAALVTGWCSKDATGGSVLEVVNIREEVASGDNLVKYDWLAKGMIKPDLKIRLTMGSNPFLGISIGVCCDFFGKLTQFYGGDTKIPIDVCNELPNFVCPISEQGVFEFPVNMNYAGYNLFQTETHFADPVLIVYVINTNTLPASDDWFYSLEVIVTSAEQALSVANKPLVTLPGLTGDTIPIDIWRGPYNIRLGKTCEREVNVGLHLGANRGAGQNKTIVSFPAAYIQLLQSVGGVLHGEVIQTGSRAISCEMYAIIQSTNTARDIHQAIRLPGCRIPTGGGKFAIRIQSSFLRANVHNTNTWLTFLAIGGPIGAQAISAPYQFMVHLSHIENEGDVLPRPICNSLRFSWATISALEDNTGFIIPARLCDLVLLRKKVTMHRNALAYLIASCGFFRGHITYIFQWSLKVAHVTPTTTLTISSHMGTLDPINTNYCVQTWITPISHSFEVKVPIDLVDYPGYNTSGGIGNKHVQPFIQIQSDGFAQFAYINISVELTPGFELYGRSVTPF